MRNVRRFVSFAALALLVAAPSTGHAQTPAPSASTPGTEQRFADGNDWTKASVDERHAFLFGIVNAISVALGWDERHVPADQVTFSRRARDGLAGTSLGEAVTRIDAWYAANPGRLGTPVVAVIWLDIAKPKLQGRKK
jgi:hypothetical protein